ncbi:MAG: DNA polymerase III subunit alpha [Acidimicrobiia bacterium]|nr:DNA polymerase III subunit alpha [Acidimicrobiia bacterium]NNF65623.1 DNA polymerase III subunit alpha [Acidimicrobiia bacterium]
MDSFAHLHVHSEFSMLDGAARIDDLVAAAHADGQPAVAITDHGVLYGVVDFYKAATKQGIKPIIGIEAYLTPGSRFDRPPRRDDVRYHMNLLAVNETGYSNLMKLASRAYLDGFYYKPRMDDELLSEHSEGIIATSGCLGGPVAQLLGPDADSEEGNSGGERDYDGALAAAARYQDIFGRENFFIELQDHGIPAQRKVTPDLLQIAKDIDAPLLATNDLHYTHAHEADAHDVLLCIQTGSNRDDEKRFRFDSREFYLKSAAEMRQLFPAEDFPGACDNTLLVAERADLTIEFGKILLPEFPVPAGATEASHLRDLVMEGAKERYGDLLSDEVRSRIDYELEVINKMGFDAYFLIVWDLIRYAREHKIRTGPGRGSAAGSIVAYCLKITAIDPLAYGLIFERFLNPGRREMPDIDMDFDERYRADVIRYCAERYGSDHVAQIVTFSTIKGRQALRDAARVLGFPYALGDKVSKLMPPAILGKEATLQQCMEPPPPEADDSLKDWYTAAAGLRDAGQTDPQAKEVIETARGLEGLRRQDSIHAAAVVIAPVPLTDIVPLQRKGDDAEVVTQYEMHGVESLGLLKMDFLGLRNLSTIERALELIELSTGELIDIDNIALDDKAVFEMLQAGDSMGVFQFEGGPMRALMRNLQPDRFEHLIALNALYRPGPLGAGMHTEYADRKNGRSPVSYPHPDLETVLGDTFGIMVFQEQVMQTAQKMAGFSMVEADSLRKAMGKKIPAVMAQQEAQFVSGCLANGHTEELARELFGFIAHFAGYGFNKSHSAAYGLVAYQTAWLKAHYPAEYMAALLTSTKRDKDRTALYLHECRTMSLRVEVPDVNRSESDFVVRDGLILFGLSAVRNVGEAVVEQIVEARQDGPFTSFTDFVNRVDINVLNKRTIESLIKAGAFESVGHSRKGLMLVFEQILDAVVSRRRNEEMGQFSLFGGDDSAVAESPIEISSDEWSKKIKLGFEKEMLGLYISDHPLFGAERALARLCSSDVPGLWDFEDKAKATVGGIVGSVSTRYTKGGDPMYFFELEDLKGRVEVVCFPRTVAEYGPMIREDAVVVITGRVDHRGDDIKLIAQEVREPELSDEGTVRLRIPASRLSRNMVDRLRAVLTNHPGAAPVYLHMTGESAEKVVRLGDDHRVEPRSALYAELRELFGHAAVM